MGSKVSTMARTVFNKQPFISNCSIYGAFYVGADYSQQLMNRKYLPNHPEINYSVLPKLGFVGGCVYSPSLYLWYSLFLDKYFIGTGAKMVVTKVLMDQCVITPYLLCAFYITMSILEGKPDLFEDLRNKFKSTYIANWSFWGPAQLVNFAIIPPKFRVLYMAIVSFAWINILCFIKRGQVTETASKKNN